MNMFINKKTSLDISVLSHEEREVFLFLSCSKYIYI